MGNDMKQAAREAAGRERKSTETDERTMRTASEALSQLAGRDDVVLRDGVLTLINESRTPREAMIDDLLFVRDALDAAGVKHLLIRGAGDRPTLAVNWKDRKAMAAALVRACRSEPFYIRAMDTGKKKTRLVADGAIPSGKKARVFRVFRPRVHPIGGLEYGHEIGVQIELWWWGSSEVVLPQENAVTRNVVPVDEITVTEIERFGRTWTTIADMFADHANDVTFDIDIVFSWVDGSDPEYRRVRAEHMGQAVVGEGDEAEARYRQVDELRYALRSVYTFAPWIRKIFIASDSPVPHWLAEHPRVQVVRSEEFFEHPEVLPTYNSQAVESQLHHIEGLSEYFLYSNDDMFFGRSLTPDMFFSPGGLTKFIEANTRIGLGDNNEVRSGFENSARVNRRLLNKRFGRITTRHLEHCAAPLRKSVIAEMEREFPEEFRATAASRFRAADNISVTNSLYHYYALMTGRAIVKLNAKVGYIDTTMRSGLDRMWRMLKRRNTDMFCLNDGSFPEVDAETRESEMHSFLEQYFPIRAPWEKPDA